MELLFKTECDNLILYNSDKLIFKADNKYLDINGKEVLAEGIENHVDLEKERYYEKDEKCGTSKVIVPISTKIPYEGEDDDIGFYGYYDKEGNEVIKPQYSCAHAWEFNKYGIVIVQKNGRRFPIDINGNKLYVPDDVSLCLFNDYSERFIDFEILPDRFPFREGYYDTKTRTYIYDVDLKDILEIKNSMDIVIKRNGKLKEVYML